MLKNSVCILLLVIFIYSCGSSQKTTTKRETSKEEAVVIANDSLEYEIIIYDIGFSTYLNSIAKPEWYYTQDYLETKNIMYVTEWNIRFNNPARYGTFYGSRIDYSPHVDYGLEVNYKLFNYFQFIRYKYGILL